MFNSNTAFIIGAGASHEAGLPIGSGLTERIAELVNLHVQGGIPSRGDHEIYQSMRILGSQEQWADNRFIASGRAVAEAMELAPSIDTFLESHKENPEFVKIGKMGIVRAISLAEAGSKLAPGSDDQLPISIKSLASTWYYGLARQLFNGVPANQPHLAFENVSFVVFNYDRCLQHFLKRAVEVYFRLTAEQADAVVQKATFIHPYGTLGSVFEGENGRLRFGQTRFDIASVSDRIRTFSESSELADEVRSAVIKADTLVFLGFGFHEQNMALLDVAKDIGAITVKPKMVYATTMELSSSDEAVVRNQISYALIGRPLSNYPPNRIHTHNGSCYGLFGAYWRSLAA